MFQSHKYYRIVANIACFKAEYIFSIILRTIVIFINIFMLYDVV